MSKKSQNISNSRFDSRALLVRLITAGMSKVCGNEAGVSAIGLHCDLGVFVVKSEVLYCCLRESSQNLNKSNDKH